MMMYEDERGGLVTIGQLWDEFEDLKYIDPKSYDYDFEQYVNECTGKDGTLTPVNVSKFEYETVFSELGRSVQRFMDAFGIRYELNEISNMIWHFEITATDRQRAKLCDHIRRVMTWA